MDYPVTPERLIIATHAPLDATERTELAALRATVTCYHNAMIAAENILATATRALGVSGYPLEVTYLSAIGKAKNALHDARVKCEGGK
jgi:hypothetical protein